MLSRARGFGSGIACTLQQRDAQRSLQRSDKAAAKATTKLASAKQQESPLAASQQQQTMLWVVAEQKERSGQAAAAAAAATLGFAAVAADVFLDQSPHLLSSLDAAAHSWVSSLVGSMPVVQHLLAGEGYAHVGSHSAGIPVTRPHPCTCTVYWVAWGQGDALLPR